MGPVTPPPTKRGPPCAFFVRARARFIGVPRVFARLDRVRVRACTPGARVYVRVRAYARLYLARVRGYYLRVRCQYWRAVCPRGGRGSGMLDSGAECVQSVTRRNKTTGDCTHGIHD